MNFLSLSSEQKSVLDRTFLFFAFIIFFSLFSLACNAQEGYISADGIVFYLLATVGLSFLFFRIPQGKSLMSAVTVFILLQLIFMLSLRLYDQERQGLIKAKEAAIQKGQFAATSLEWMTYKKRTDLTYKVGQAEVLQHLRRYGEAMTAKKQLSIQLDRQYAAASFKILLMQIVNALGIIVYFSRKWFLRKKKGEVVHDAI